MFGKIQQKAIDQRRTWIIYFGPSGHGRGLVDSMSSFGVKAVLRKEIINNDFYWSSSSEIVTKLRSMNMGARMHYYEVKMSDIENQSEPDEYPIAGCQKLHSIAFHPDGSVELKRDICDCDRCFIGKFSECCYEVGNNSDVEDDEEDGEDDSSDDNDDGDEEDEDEEIDLSDVVVVGSVVALRTPVDVHESFYLVKVNEILVAETELFDSYQHFITEGMQFLRCSYLIVELEAKSYIQYKLLSRDVYILPGEIHCPFVNISDDLRLSKVEKQWLDDCA